MLDPYLKLSSKITAVANVKDKTIKLIGENGEEYSISVICRWENLLKFKTKIVMEKIDGFGYIPKKYFYLMKTKAG